jgi:hypothetical protein
MTTVNELEQEVAQTGNAGQQRLEVLRRENKPKSSGMQSKRLKVQQATCLQSLKSWRDIAARFGIGCEIEFDEKSGVLMMRANGWITE